MRAGIRRRASFLSSAVQSLKSFLSRLLINCLKSPSFLRVLIRASVCRYSPFVFQSVYASRIRCSSESTFAFKAFCTLSFKNHCTAASPCACSASQVFKLIRFITAFNATSRALIVSANTARAIRSSLIFFSSSPILFVSLRFSAFASASSASSPLMV